MSLSMTSGMNSETTRFHVEPMLQLLGLGVLWAQNDARQVHTTRPTRGRVLYHRDR